jgi:hypothetical protein
LRYLEDMEKITDKTIPQRILKCVDNPYLEGWDKNFLASIMDYYNRTGGLSQGQHDIFKRIEGQCTEEAMKLHADWTKEYDDEKRKRFKVAVDFYLKSSYYSNITSKVVKNADYVPKRKEYDALVNNKYAQKVMEGTFGEPKYAIGTNVVARSSSGWYTGKQGTIIDVLPYVKSAVKGNKICRVLWFGESKIVELEERHLRSLREKDYLDKSE